MKVFKVILSLLLVFNFSCSDTIAIYDEIPENNSVDAVAISGLFKKRVLIEDYTGTWCGNCARVAHAIDLVKNANDKAVSVAIHNGNDPFNFTGIAPLKNLISPNSDLQLPQSRLNRKIVWKFPEVDNLSQVKNLTSNNCPIGLAIKSNIENRNIILDVKVKFAKNYSDVKLVVYLLEDNLIYFQTNYSNFFGAINPIPNFNHNHVLRANFGNIMGESLVGTTFGKVVTTSFSIPVPANIVNVENVNFVAFVTDSENNVINVRATKTKNEDQTFEENP